VLYNNKSVGKQSRVSAAQGHGASGFTARRSSARILALSLLAGTALNAAGATVKGEPGVDEEVVVSAERGPDSAASKAAPESELGGQKLLLRREGTLGATVEGEPGVHNASFGPGVGVPVIRGLTGQRIRIVQDGLATHDGASTSPDHAITVDTAMAENIRILRGPGTVRHGSNAMGGVVEVDEGRIPREPVGVPLTGFIESRMGVEPDRHQQAFKLRSGLGPVSAQIGGALRESGLVPIPGSALNEEAVLDQFGDDVEFENPRGELPNSDTEARSGHGGFSLAGPLGYLGASFGYLDNEYGIPPGGLPPHSDTPGLPPQPQRIRIDMLQRRHAVEAALTPTAGFVERVSIEGGLVNYRHDETERQFVSTTFINDVREARGELAHRVREAVPGSVGVHWIERDFSAEGFETFVPASNIQMFGIYGTQGLRVGPLEFEVAAREERVLTRPEDSTRTIGGFLTVELPSKLEYEARTYAAAAELSLLPGLSLRVDWSRAARAPDVQELLSLGPHLSTRSFDVGNIALEIERARTVDVGLLADVGPLRLRLNAFERRIDDFIYQENLGFLYDVEERIFRLECVRIDRCVPVFGYLQQDASFAGFESELAFLHQFGAVLVELSFFADYVRGYFEAEGAGDVPRLPPRMAGVVASIEGEHWLIGARYADAAAQGRAGRRESATDGYRQLSAEFTYRQPLGSSGEAQLFVRGQNLLDEEIRNSTSFLRDFMPEGGRSIEVGLRLGF
jgi:iron complex outermembrane recepter protein